MKLKSVFCVFAAFFAIPAFAQNVMEKKIDRIVSTMNLEEKIGQMTQISFDGRSVDEAEEMIKAGKVGSLLNITDPVLINKLQHTAVKESRLGIPLIIGRDVIHGFKTIFPIPLGQAASFDSAMVRKCAKVAAMEASSIGINWTFAPMLDISRDARWGRIAESLGEDPFLDGKLGSAMVRGFQENGSGRSLAACVKHFVGYGAAEGGRDYNTSFIPPYLLRNVYLPPFLEGIKAGALSLMCSFNDNDGVPSSGNEFLLKTVLRKEWGFQGLTVSDWCSIIEMINRGFAKDEKDAADRALNAGLDMEMVSTSYRFIPDLLKEGKIKIEDIDNAVKNILRVKLELGLFEHPYTDVHDPVFYSKESLTIAKQMAEESAVLLKNNGILPLSFDKKIAIVGPLADAHHDQLGTWIFDGEKNHTLTPLDVLKSGYEQIKYEYVPGLAFSRDIDTTKFTEVRQVVAQSDLAVVFLGEESILSGEAHSLSNLNLIGRQSDLLKAVKSTGKPVVLVIMAGRPLTIERDLPYADAVLYNFHPGTMGGPAILNLLFGKANPSGKLPVTFVRESGQIPMYYNHNNTGRPATDKVTTLDEIPQEAGQTSLGNTSFYLDSGKDPLFPFGFGLSYSQFEYSDLKLSSKKIPIGGKLKITVNLKNVSKMDGTEVVQLYIRDLVGSIIRPVKELKGFQRVYLSPGETKKVEFILSTDELAFYGIDGKFKTEAGDFKLWVGPDSQKGMESNFSVE